MKQKDKLKLLAVVAIIAIVVLPHAMSRDANPSGVVRENWFGSDAWKWTKKKASAVGKAIGNMASATWDGIVYETTKPAFGDTAAYEHSMMNWATKDSRGNPRGIGSSFGRLALGFGGMLPVVGLDAIQSTLQLPFKAIRYVGDADYRDHVFDHGSGFSTWFDNSYDDTLHPLPAGRGHAASQHHKIPFLPIRW
jgi:hypothetical protein